MHAHALLPSPIGTLTLVASPTALVAIHFEGRVPDLDGAAVPVAAHPVLARTAAELDAYFAGERTTFTVPLDGAGTDWQRAVWRALVEIPYGATCGYGELAHALGRPTASRAVGAANGRNPIPVIVPCHRVIGKDGTLTGYAGGLAIKQWLLAHETKHRA